MALGGNGFIAAFTGGLAFAAADGPAAKLIPFVEETGTMLSLLVGSCSGWSRWCRP